jgi:hypothetical protein
MYVLAAFTFFLLHPTSPCILIHVYDTDTANEYHKFMADARRLAEDVSGNQTFNTVKPLLNFWAAFSPSNEVSRSVSN